MSAAPVRAALRGGFPLAMRVVHWATALLLVGSFSTMWAITGGSSSDEVERLSVIHRSIGVLMLCLIILRFVLRQSLGVPEPPANVPVLQRIAATANVISLYFCLLIQPLLGLLMSMLHGEPITLLGGLVIPPIVSPDRHLARSLLEAHGAVATALLGAIGVHVAAALYHHFIRRDDVLTRMLPSLPTLSPSRRSRRETERT